MTVTAHPKDTRGSELNAAITARSTQMSSLASGSVSRLAATVQLDSDQQALVIYFMSNGRLKASDILSTMT